MSRNFLCRCEDIDTDEVHEAIAHGHDDLESLRRYTAIGTGPCQGKACINETIRLLAAHHGVAEADIGQMTLRPPFTQIPLGYLAELDEDALEVLLTGQAREQERQLRKSLQSNNGPRTGRSTPESVERRLAEHQATRPEQTRDDGDTHKQDKQKKQNKQKQTEKTEKTEQKGQQAGRGGPSMKDRAHVVVIGAGAIGLGVAYELVRRGETDVVVLDRQHLNFGATARNGGGVRAQWTTKANIELARESIRRFKRLSQELGNNLFWRQCGYLFCARNDDQIASLEKSVAFHNAHGVRTRLMEPDEALRIIPELDIKGAGVVKAAYNADDATLFPWPLVWGYHERCKEAGVEIHPFTQVTGLIMEPSTNRVQGVHTDKGTIRCDWVVNATGAWANTITRMAGLELPIRPERHEILVTEPLKPFLRCMLVDMKTGLYANQSSRGEIVSGISEPEHAITMDWRSTLPFLLHQARTITKLLPVVKGVSLLRQWAGSYDMTPDGKPIIEAHEEAPGLITAAGFSGHGIMTSPVSVEIAVDLIQGKRPRFDMYGMSTARFLPGAKETEKETMVIG